MQRIISIKNIQFNPAIYPRVNDGQTWKTSYQYAMAMKAGAKFPPVIVSTLGKGQYQLIDGKHRIKAYKQNKTHHINCIVLNKLNDKEAYFKAVQFNAQHGRPLTPYEKVNIVLKLKGLGYSNKAISTVVCIPKCKLNTFMAERTAYSLTTGEQFALKAPLKHLAGEEIDLSKEMQKSFNNSSQLEIINELLHLLNNNLIDLQDSKVINGLKQLKKALKSIK